MLGNSELPHRGADPVLRRGPRLALPDRPVRDAGPAGLAGSDQVGTRSVRPWSSEPSSRFVARPLSVLASAIGQRDWLPGRTSSSSPRPACGAPSRSCWRPSRWPRRAGLGPALRPRVRAGRDLHHRHRPDPAVGRPAAGRRTAARGVRATSTSRRRPSNGSRRTCCRSRSPPSRGCTASRSVSCGYLRAPRCRLIVRGGDHGAQRAHRAAARRRPAGGDPPEPRMHTEKRLRRCQRRGRLAQWLDDGLSSRDAARPALLT